MIDEINFDKFKGKIIDRIKTISNWRETEYESITIYFTDGKDLRICGRGEDCYLDIDN